MRLRTRRLTALVALGALLAPVAGALLGGFGDADDVALAADMGAAAVFAVVAALAYRVSRSDGKRPGQAILIGGATALFSFALMVAALWALTDIVSG